MLCVYLFIFGLIFIEKQQPSLSSATRIFFYYCNQLEDNTSHKQHCSFSENGKQNKTTFIYFLPRYWTMLIFTCSDEIGLEIILWQYDLHNKEKIEHLPKRKKKKIPTQNKTNKHLGVLCITSHRSITVLHFDISNLWLSNIQLRQSQKNNGSIVDKFVREREKKNKETENFKRRIKTSTNKKQNKMATTSSLGAFCSTFGRFERNTCCLGLFRQ